MKKILVRKGRGRASRASSNGEKRKALPACRLVPSEGKLFIAAFDNFYFSGKFSSLQTVVNSQGHFIPRFLVYQNKP